MHPLRPLLTLVGCVLAVVATAVPAHARSATVPLAVTVALPPANGRFDYQIGGAYAPLSSVAIVDRDRGDQPVAGRYNICYVNAFQSQPEDKAFWLGQHADLLLRKDGKLVGDPDWPGEYLLNTSTAATRKGILAVVGRWIDGCASKGFQAVEPDNMDSWTRSEKLLDQADNLAMSTLLASRAHADGLAIGQKNTSQFGATGRDVAHLDFAIAEECQRYDECGAYTRVYGARVIEIEYTDYSRSSYTAACAARGRTISVIRRDRDVVPKSDGAYRYEAC